MVRRKKKVARQFAVRSGKDRRPETPAAIRYKPTGVVLTFVGYGAYPYDCISKDKFPDAAVYGNDEKGCWTGETVGPDGMPCLTDSYEPLTTKEG